MATKSSVSFLKNTIYGLKYSCILDTNETISFLYYFGLDVGFLNW